MKNGKFFCRHCWHDIGNTTMEYAPEKLHCAFLRDVAVRKKDEMESLVNSAKITNDTINKFGEYKRYLHRRGSVWVTKKIECCRCGKIKCIGPVKMITKSG